MITSLFNDAGIFPHTEFNLINRSNSTRELRHPLDSGYRRRSPALLYMMNNKQTYLI